MKLKVLAAVISLWVCMLNLQCVFPSKVAGNGSQAPNSAIVGMIFQPGGKEPARGDTVVIRSWDYLVDIQKLSKQSTTRIPLVRRTCTNDSGYFRFDSIPKETYCIEAHDFGGNRVLIEVNSSLFRSDTVKLSPDTLKVSASIRGKIVSGFVSTGTFVRIFGLDRSAKVGPDSAFSLNNLPAGNLRLLFTINLTDNISFDTIMKIKVAEAADTLLSLSIIDPKTRGSGITFRKTLGEDCTGNSVRQTSDGGYIVAGDQSSIDWGTDTAFLLKTDAVGTTLWRRTFRGDGTTSARSVQQTSDGGYIIIGSVYYSATNKDSLLLIKTDAIGTTVWTKTLGGFGIGIGNPIRQTKDGGYVIVGSTPYDGARPEHVCLIKTDAIGTALWTKTFGENDYNSGNSVQQTRDGGYIIAGGTRPNNPSSTFVYLIKTDSMGTAVWTKAFGDDGVSDIGNSVQQTGDGGYMIVGTDGINLIKTDSTGTIVWKRLLGRYGSVCNSGQPTSDGGYIIVGNTYVTYDTPYYYAVYLLKTDATGMPVWSKTFGGDYDAYGNSVEQTSDGGYVITGFYNRTENEAFLIKTDRNGEVK
jgi:hypothetical protein